MTDYIASFVISKNAEQDGFFFPVSAFSAVISSLISTTIFKIIDRYIKVIFWYSLLYHFYLYYTAWVQIFSTVVKWLKGEIII